MSWFHRTKLERVTKERKQRREAAEDLRESVIKEEFFSDVRLIKDALREAKGEPSVFEGYVGETMPRHMADALEFEIKLWAYLDDLTQHQIQDEQAYKSFCMNLRPLVGVLCDLLHLEEEMVNSCLVRHYERALDMLRAEASRVRR